MIYLTEVKLIRGFRWASISALAENLFQSQVLSLLRYELNEVARLGLLECAGGGLWGEEGILCIFVAIEGSSCVENRLYIKDVTVYVGVD